MLIGNGPVHLEPWLAAAMKVRRMVCAVEKPRDRNAGTGFLIGPNLVLTAFHVIAELAADAAAMASLRVVFDRHLLADRFHVGRASTYAVASLFDSSERLDFAVLALQWPAGEEMLQDEVRGWVDLPQTSQRLTKDSCLTVIHHPRPEALYLSPGVVTDVAQRGTRIRYRTATEGGSSGAPCFDYRWNVVAMHLGTRRTRAAAPLYSEAIPIDEVRRAMVNPPMRRSPADLHRGAL